jgi:hypothetical protein
MQLRREAKPRLSRMACQMLWWLGALLGAGRLGRDLSTPLARIALEQAKVWMFRRRTGHERLLFPGLRRSNLPRIESGRAEVRLNGRRLLAPDTSGFDDAIEKVSKCRAANFAPKHKASSYRHSMSPQIRHGGHW